MKVACNSSMDKRNEANYSETMRWEYGIHSIRTTTTMSTHLQHSVGPLEPLFLDDLKEDDVEQGSRSQALEYGDGGVLQGGLDLRTLGRDFEPELLSRQSFA